MMPTRTIYFDESGFTGQNLLDPNQPIFSIASAQIPEERAKEVLKTSFPRYRGNEFKFSKIWSSKSRPAFVGFAGQLKDVADLCFVYVVDKRFAVLTKIVDFLIEPYLTDLGYDFYGDGFCWKYSNYIYFGMTHFAPPELLDALLRHYQAFSRDVTPENLRLLQIRLNTMASSSEEPVRIFLEQMALGAEQFLRYHNLEKFVRADELQTTSMIAVVSHWRQKYEEDFEVVHDASSNFLRDKFLWDRITSPNVPAQLVRGGDGSFVRYPLRVTSTVAMDSRDSSSIQFCDILAGLAARHLSPKIDGDDRTFLNSLVSAGLNNITYNGIRPDTVFPDQIPPKKLVGSDTVDQMMGIIYGPHNERS